MFLPHIVGQDTNGDHCSDEELGVLSGSLFLWSNASTSLEIDGDDSLIGKRVCEILNLGCV